MKNEVEGGYCLVHVRVRFDSGGEYWVASIANMKGTSESGGDTPAEAVNRAREVVAERLQAVEDPEEVDWVDSSTLFRSDTDVWTLVRLPREVIDGI